MQKTENTPEYRLPQDTEALIFELCGMMLTKNHYDKRM